MEGRIFYPFHPRHGLIVSITGRNRHQGADVFIVRQPDGTLAYVPVWMMREPAADHEVIAAPRLPLASLRDLRLELDGLLSFLRGDSSTEDKGDEVKVSLPAARTIRRGRGPDRVVAGSEATSTAAPSGDDERDHDPNRQSGGR
jgi:hypothetical protein